MGRSGGRKSWSGQAKSAGAAASSTADHSTSSGDLAGDSFSSFAISELVWGWDGKHKCWRKAQIVSLERPIPNPDSSVREAYLHWKGFDRRLDCWVNLDLIKKLDKKSELPGDFGQDEISDDDSHAGMDVDYLKEHQENTKFKTINQIRMRNVLVDTWYFSPYPLEIQNTSVLHICSFCLQFFKHQLEFDRHQRRCTARYPPGNEIYRDMNLKLAVWEVDGGIARIYCENLCFLSKLFLDHKTLRHPVQLFLFYVMTEMGVDGYHIVGYFSKEKYSRNNVSCILTLPQYQKKGYGKYLINFSYVLAQIEGRRGTPERPLSDLGKASYMNYWRQVLLEDLKDQNEFVIGSIADKYALEPTDMVNCLEQCGVLNYEKSTSEPFVALPPESVELLSLQLGKPAVAIKKENLHWLPYDPFLGPFEYSAET